MIWITDEFQSRLTLAPVGIVTPTVFSPGLTVVNWGCLASQGAVHDNVPVVSVRSRLGATTFALALDWKERRMNRILVALFSICLTGLLMAATPGASTNHAPAVVEDEALFPFDFELPNLDGETVTKADYEGKVLIVDIWGIWCPPCRMEIPHFVELHEKYKDQGFDIVGINYEGVPDEQAIPKIRDFIKKYDMPYMCVLGDRATQMQVPNFRGYPTTLFLDRQGNVRKVFVGYREMEVLDETIAELIGE